MIDKEYIKSIISGIVSEKEKKGIKPPNATLSEVLEVIRESSLACMREMCGSGELLTNKTLNSVSFKLP